MIPLNPYEQIALTGLAPGETEDEVCELCGREIKVDDVFLWRDKVTCCERCYLEMTTEE